MEKPSMTGDRFLHATGPRQVRTYAIHSDAFSIDIPQHRHIVCVGVNQGHPRIVVVADPHSKETRHDFFVVKTNEDFFAPAGAIYLGSYTRHPHLGAYTGSSEGAPPVIGFWVEYHVFLGSRGQRAEDKL